MTTQCELQPLQAALQEMAAYDVAPHPLGCAVEKPETPGVLKSDGMEVADHLEFSARLKKNARWSSVLDSVSREHCNNIVYLYTKVHFVGAIDSASQQFSARFDLHVCWRPEFAPDKFEPIIRFPDSVTWNEVMRVPLNEDHGGELHGFRRTIEGQFRSELFLRGFPFDAQALRIEMALGRCASSGQKLTMHNGWRLEHHPSEANMILKQNDNTYAFRPLRFFTHQSTFLEDAEKVGKYTLVIPVVRDYQHFINNQYLFVFLNIIMNDTLPYCVPVQQTSSKLAVNLTLYLLLVAYKFAIQAELPKLPYNTCFDAYLMFAFLNMTLTLLGIGFIGARGLDADAGDAVEDMKLYTWWFSKGMGVVAVLSHLYFGVDAWLHSRRCLDILKVTGQLDEPLVELLSSAGINFKDGLVSNIGRYQELLSLEQPLP
eukprot:TRINITY_DN41815_c0_g1_i1.p1 TRINITY_DN41815_c0_g1~~TRINITY_DN41815_c0_g1_i1.p1  ORF type:complete len:474 (+),score=63.36 TRINITY_DN41815_c0_g1_i1:133-1422(+)